MQLVALGVIYVLIFSAIPLGMCCHRERTGSWRGFWS